MGTINWRSGGYSLGGNLQLGKTNEGGIIVFRRCGGGQRVLDSNNLFIDNRSSGMVKNDHHQFSTLARITRSILVIPVFKRRLFLQEESREVAQELIVY